MQLSILVLATDPVSAGALADALGGPGHTITVVARTEEFLAATPGHSLVILDEVPSGTTVASIIVSLRQDPAAATVPVLAVAQSSDLEERIALLEANADDVITKPFDRVELNGRVEALALHFQRSEGRTAGGGTIGGSGGRRIVSVFSPKGGVGTTTIATNLALIAAERHPNKTLIIDLDLSFGGVASHLNLMPKQSLLELVRDDGAMHEPELFRAYPVQHPSGVHVLAAPPAPGFASLITGEHVELILTRALETYDIVVVDAGAALDDRMLAIFARSETVLVPVLPEIPALNAVHLLLDQLAETGAVGGTTLFVLNNAFARELLRRADIETALGAKIAADLPYDPIVYLKAVNEGVPVVRSAPKSMPAERLRALATIVFGKDPAPPPPRPRPRSRSAACSVAAADGHVIGRTSIPIRRGPSVRGWGSRRGLRAARLAAPPAPAGRAPARPGLRGAKCGAARDRVPARGRLGHGLGRVGRRVARRLCRRDLEGPDDVGRQRLDRGGRPRRDRSFRRPGAICGGRGGVGRRGSSEPPRPGAGLRRGSG